MTLGKAYSVDLRKVAMEHVQAGKLKMSEIASLLKINVKTLYDWRILFEKTSSVEPKTGFQKGHSHKITDLDIFRDFVNNNSDLTAKEMADKWSATHQVSVCTETIRRNLKKIDFSFKKKLSIM